MPNKVGEQLRALLAGMSAEADAPTATGGGAPAAQETARQFTTQESASPNQRDAFALVEGRLRNAGVPTERITPQLVQDVLFDAMARNFTTGARDDARSTETGPRATLRGVAGDPSEDVFGLIAATPDLAQALSRNIDSAISQLPGSTLKLSSEVGRFPGPIGEPFDELQKRRRAQREKKK